MSRIRFVKPVATDADALADELRRCTAEGVELEISVVAESGPPSLEYLVYETVVAPGMLAHVVEAERAGCDAVVLGCFYDTALDAAREVAAVPVVAPCQSALHLAALLGTRYAIVAGRRAWVPKLRANVARYGFEAAVADYPCLDLSVVELQRDPARTYARIAAAGEQAVRLHGVDVLILGCTLEFGFAERLQADLGLPVIDAARASVKYAELAAEIARLGWRTSKAGGYACAPSEEMEASGLGHLIAAPDGALDKESCHERET